MYLIKKFLYVSLKKTFLEAQPAVADYYEECASSFTDYYQRCLSDFMNQERYCTVTYNNIFRFF